ncbi:MAG: histidine--tRNA ligase [Planctomycetota bacterium]|nr:histidine--tRNA ligase [Planctomycetota bacterium]
MNLKALPGTRDILPSEMGLWRRVEEKAREMFQRWGYREIRTPIFEDTRLFRRGIGETTDIVEKEMYTLELGKGPSLTLRPEATAPVVRAYLQHNLHKTRPFQKFFYMGPLFRHERPQAHRWRQHTQLGVEAIGSKEAWLDAETIRLAQQFFADLEITGIHLRINSLGDDQCRPAMRDRLREELGGRLDELCKKCRDRYDRNVFRILDCKEEGCRSIVAGLTDLTSLLCDDCRRHFDAVRGALTAMQIPFEHDARIVRGLDYYCRTVWEIDDPELGGSQNALGGGGRYDPLIVQLGGPDVGGVGFALGADRTIDAILARGGAGDTSEAVLDLFVVVVEASVRNEAYLLVDRLRLQGIRTDVDYEGKSVKAQMRQAHKIGVRWVAVIGPGEISRHVIRLKDMETGNEEEMGEEGIRGRLAASKGATTA